MRLRICVSVFATICTILFSSGISHATQDTIKFPVTVNAKPTYSPSTIHVSVGDTVLWLGPFTFHPLHADAFPPGVATFPDVKSGNSFSYVVPATGTYTYYCTAHVGLGMVGTFTTEDNAVPAPSGPSGSLATTRILDIMPNPATKTTMIDFELAKAGTVRISITSMDGKLLDTPLNASMEAGAQMIDYDCSKLATGSYLVTLESNGVKVSKRVVVEK